MNNVMCVLTTFNSRMPKGAVVELGLPAWLLVRGVYGLVRMCLPKVAAVSSANQFSSVCQA
jgi:hypothetical protein